MMRRVAMQVWYDEDMPRVTVFVVNHLKGRECIRAYHNIAHTSTRRIIEHFEGADANVKTAAHAKHHMVRLEWEVK